MSTEIKSILVWLALSAVLNFIAGHKSQVDGWAERRPYLAALLKVLRGFGLDPWMLIQAATLATKKRLPLSMQPDVPSPVILPPIPVPPSGTHQRQGGFSNDDSPIGP